MSKDWPIGLEAFAGLQAETEGDWFIEAFYPPVEFEYLCEGRSTLIFGVPGSGKTALYRALLHFARTRSGCIAVEWAPSFWETSAASEKEMLQTMLKGIFQAVAAQLVAHLAANPQLFPSIPEWSKRFLGGFIRYVWGENWKEETEFRLGEGGQEILETWFPFIAECSPLPPSLVASPPLLMAKLVSTVHSLGMEGVWVLSEGFERWLELDEDSVIAHLKSFLSALALFEHPRFVFKLIFPLTEATWENFKMAGAVKRRRVSIHRIYWTEEALRAMVERRLEVASGGQVQRLEELIEPSGVNRLLSWLQRWGGTSPRGWLEAIRPLVALYLNRPEPGPVPMKDWLKARRHHRPRLYVDEEEKRVTVGWREIPDLSERLFSLLLYLYHNQGRVCSREELYYRAYQKLPSIPRGRGDPDWVEKEIWNHALDSALSRLRQAVEPDPRDPQLIITVRRRGVKLEVGV